MSSIMIDRFVFHILKKAADGFDVTYLAETSLRQRAQSFFEALFEQQLAGVRYLFDQPDGAPEPPVKAQARDLLEGRTNFLATSKDLTRDFADRHAAQSTDGVFIIATATLNGRPVLVLMKYDHIEAVELLAQTQDGAPSARYTEDVLTLDKDNVMKFALIDPAGARGWDVIATDLQTRPIAEYFRAFVGVRPLRTAQEQTKSAIQTVKRWAAGTDTLPDDVLPVDVQYRAVDYMRQADTYSMDPFVERLLGKETDANRRARAALRQTLTDADLHADFGVDTGTVRGSLEKQTMQTREGVRIVMPHGAEQGNVTVETINGRRRIIIETDELRTLG